MFCSRWTVLLCAMCVISKRVTASGSVGWSCTQPKVMIISMFSPEADIWYENAHTSGSIGDLLARNITVPGLSPLFPDVHCVQDGSVCQITTGESEINAATTMTALLSSPFFDLRKTYFLIAGIAGINPKYGTISDVAFSQYAVQVALQHEFDARETPTNYTTSYIPLGSTSPREYPRIIYGTEVFEVSSALRDIAVQFALEAKLNDSSVSAAYRAKYNTSSSYAAATKAPSVIKCDVATSDVWFSGVLLSEAFENTTTILTNGSGIYCVTAQEDNATLEVLLRFAIKRVVDFSRIIIMRTGSDFDRPYPGESAMQNLFYIDQGAYVPAVENIYIAGNLVVKGLVEGWNTRFEQGVPAVNYIGDIFGSLGSTPDFGPGLVLENWPPTKRAVGGELERRRSRRRSGRRRRVGGKGAF